MNALAVNYANLVHDDPPKVIRTDEENTRWLEKLSDLNSRGDRLSAAEKDFYDTLVVLVEDYERRAYPIADVPPIEVLRDLMEANGLKQKDLVGNVFESPSVVSEIMSGKRPLTLDHIKRLSSRFNIPVSVFIGKAMVAG
jgi:HTH-type transcriptional regulator/antitoxin HigA